MQRARENFFSFYFFFVGIRTCSELERDKNRASERASATGGPRPEEPEEEAVLQVLQVLQAKGTLDLRSRRRRSLVEQSRERRGEERRGEERRGEKRNTSCTCRVTSAVHVLCFVPCS